MHMFTGVESLRKLKPCHERGTILKWVPVFKRIA